MIPMKCVLAILTSDKVDFLAKKLLWQWESLQNDKPKITVYDLTQFFRLLTWGK